jgi:hypothetical protein
MSAASASRFVAAASPVRRSSSSITDSFEANAAASRAHCRIVFVCSATVSSRSLVGSGSNGGKYVFRT